ncbi:MAG: hypothetical protein K9W44_11625 [Candidatus Lokiarchaeota archaeon]|nr:hypothetical protein [Candidatus Harpocratesius repetitus]
MIKGLILFSVQIPASNDQNKNEIQGSKGENYSNSSRVLPNWSILAKFIPEKEDEPQHETVNEIMIRYFSSNDNSTLNIRLFPFKYFIQPIKEDRSILLVYLLDAKESLEIAQIYSEETIKNLEMQINGNSELNESLEEIFTYRNKILMKLEKEGVLQEEIGHSANRLIDSGKFDEAQDLIKLAKTIPEKMVSTYLKSKLIAKEHSYRQARKLLGDCLSLAQKIEDDGIIQYLNKKIEIFTQIPQYEKDVRSLISSFSKELSKSINLPSYQRQVYKLDKTLDLLDKLEEDELIEKIMELSNTLILAGKLVFDLKSLDKKIKNIISEL